MIGEKGADMILDLYEDERHEAIRLAEEKRKQQELEAAAAAALAQAQSSTTTAQPSQSPQQPAETDTDDYDYDIRRLRADLQEHKIKEEDVRKLDPWKQEEMFLVSYYKHNKEFFDRAAKNFTRLND